MLAGRGAGDYYLQDIAKSLRSIVHYTRVLFQEKFEGVDVSSDSEGAGRKRGGIASRSTTEVPNSQSKAGGPDDEYIEEVISDDDESVEDLQ